MVLDNETEAIGIGAVEGLRDGGLDGINFPGIQPFAQFGAANDLGVDERQGESRMALRSSERLCRPVEDLFNQFTNGGSVMFSVSAHELHEPGHACRQRQAVQFRGQGAGFITRQNLLGRDANV